MSLRTQHWYRTTIMLLGLCMLLLPSGSARAAERERSTLLITGSSTMCPLIADIARQFQLLHKGVHIEVQCGGSDRGIRDIKDGKSDIAMVSRAMTDQEKGLYGFPIARDGVSIIVHKGNPVKALSNAQLVAIFSGKISNWKQVGGPDAPMTVILREKQKPVTELFMSYFGLKENIKGRIIPGDNPVTINAVAADHHAIGYVSSGEAERRMNAGTAIRILPVNGMLPTSRNVITGNYPLARPLSLVSRDLPAGLVKEFINYCLSSKVVETIERFDFVPYED